MNFQLEYTLLEFLKKYKGLEVGEIFAEYEMKNHSEYRNILAHISKEFSYPNIGDSEKLSYYNSILILCKVFKKVMPLLDRKVLNNLNIGFELKVAEGRVDVCIFDNDKLLAIEFSYCMINQQYKSLASKINQVNKYTLPNHTSVSEKTVCLFTNSVLKGQKLYVNEEFNNQKFNSLAYNILKIWK